MKYLFFDVDGTLLPFGRGLPENTLHALCEAQANGNRIFLSTGRSPAEMDPRLKDVRFDGGVYCGGSRAFAGGKDVFSSFISRADLEYTSALCAQKGWSLLMQCDDSSWYKDDFYELYLSFLDKYVGGRIKVGCLRKAEELPFDRKSTKLILLTPDGDMAEARALLSDRYDVLNNTIGVPSSLMAEVCQKNVNKAVGMKAILSYFGASVSDAVAFGDGSNDVEIIKEAGIGVAMGNACDEIKAAADYITSECTDDGIGKALRHFGII